MPAIAGIPGPVAHTPEWKSLRVFDPDRKSRPVVFGASEAAAACDVSPYSSALQVYLEKRGQLEDRADDEATDMGRRLEPIILDLYEERMNCGLLREQRTYFHKDFDFMSATPDGLAYAVDPEHFDWAVDSKSSSFRMYDATGDNEARYGVDGTDQIPLTALFQAQQQMAVTGLERVDFPVLFDGRTFRVYTVIRNDDLIDQIASAENYLALRIIAGEPPEPNYRHEGTRSLLHKMFGFKEGKQITLPQEMKQLAIDLENARLAKKTAESAEEEAKARLDQAMGDAEVVRFEGEAVHVTRRQNAPTLWTRENVETLERQLEHARANVGQIKREGARPTLVRRK